MGENHLRVLSLMKDVEIKFIYDNSKKRLNELSKIYNVNPTQSLEKALQIVTQYIYRRLLILISVFLKSVPIKLKIFFLRNHLLQI